MSQKVFENLAEFYLKLKVKSKASQTVVDIFTTLVKANHIFICLPEKLEDFGIARNYIREIRNNFSEARITFLFNYNYFNLMDRNDRENSNLILLKPENINRFGLCNQPITQKVNKIKYEVAIDLNFDFNLMSAHLCYISNAPLRICLSNEKRDPFFNFQIQASTNTLLDTQYRNLLKYISIKPAPSLS
jgi:ADP-heptose:LPS heptosyltransferase